MAHKTDEPTTSHNAEILSTINPVDRFNATPIIRPGSSLMDV